MPAFLELIVFTIVATLSTAPFIPLVPTSIWMRSPLLPSLLYIWM